jgi:hypothetical protein
LFHPERDTAHVHFDGHSAHPFDPRPGLFSGTNGWWLAEAALLAYWASDPTAGDPSGARQRFAQAGLTSYRFITRRPGATCWTDPQCHVAGNDTFVIVSFRGTQADQLLDVVNDVTFRPTPLDGTAQRVHAGFLSALDAIQADLMTAIEDLCGGSSEGNRPTLWLTGHSLGAALAVLAAARLARSHKPVEGIYIVGCPRVGDGAFKAAFDQAYAGRCWRYVNNHDIVTQVPPAGALLGYEHVGQEIHFDGKGQRAAPPGSVAHFLESGVGALSHVRQTAAALLQGGLTELPPSLLDHTPARYAALAWNSA